MDQVRFGRLALGVCAALYLVGCGGSASVPQAAWSQGLQPAATTRLQWVPGSVTLDVNGSLSAKRKAVTLVVPSHKGGVEYRWDCDPYFDLKDTGKRVKHGITYLGYVLTATTHRVYGCSWEALIYVAGQQQTSTLTIKITH